MGTETNDLRYLELLARQYPSIQAASTEIINLSAILHLPARLLRGPSSVASG